jgi:hypothetical protein
MLVAIALLFATPVFADEADTIVSLLNEKTVGWCVLHAEKVMNSGNVAVDITLGNSSGAKMSLPEIQIKEITDYNLRVNRRPIYSGSPLVNSFLVAEGITYSISTENERQSGRGIAPKAFRLAIDAIGNQITFFQLKTWYAGWARLGFTIDDFKCQAHFDE